MAGIVRGARVAANMWSARLNGFDVPTVWHEFTPLAQTLGAVNLGQGFPFVKDALHHAVDNNQNQYTRSGGHMRLVQALAKHYSPLLGQQLDPLTQIATCVGATEAIFACTQSLLNPGDEVVVFEPAFDIYRWPVARVASFPFVFSQGGRFLCSPLTHRDDGQLQWTYNHAEFEAAFTPKTRMLLINTPHNPTGKVFKPAELAAIAETRYFTAHPLMLQLSKHPDVIVVSDEVYENLVYDGVEHTRIATLPGMFDRTITVSSAGKTFSITGWKIGWTIGPAHLIKPVMLANQWVQFSVPTPLQEAVAEAFEAAQRPYEGHPTFYSWLRADYTRKRDFLGDALSAAGFGVAKPEGGFFIVADTSKFQVPDKFLNETTAAAPVMTRDWAFCRYLAYDHGIVAIPPSAFYSPATKALAANMTRFAFCKTDESLAEAKRRFKAFADKVSS